MIKDNVLDLIAPFIKDKEVYLVGGYLRNFFLKNEVSFDRDLVTTSPSKDLAKTIADELFGTFIELDSENKIYRVVLEDKKNFFDITETKDILLDSKRRDFTINSIFYDLNKKEFFDPCSGIKDIKNKTIRTPDLNNLKDDPLRLLRLYRFYSQTGFKIENSLETFTKENFSLVLNCAKERINHEIIEIFKGEFLSQTLLKMFEDNALEKIFPFIKEIKRVPSNSHHHLDLVHHSIETARKIKSDNPLLKIAAFYHDIAKPLTWTIEPEGRHRFIGHDIVGSEIVKEELSALKFSNKQIAYISKMIKYHIYPATLINCEDSKKAFARFIRKLGEDSADIIELSRADRLSALGPDVTKEMVERALNHLDNLLDYYNKVKNEVKNPAPLLSGKEIMDILNLKPSKLVGEIKDSLLEAQLSGEVKTPLEAINFIKKAPVNFNESH